MPVEAALLEGLGGVVLLVILSEFPLEVILSQFTSRRFQHGIYPFHQTVHSFPKNLQKLHFLVSDSGTGALSRLPDQ